MREKFAIKLWKKLQQRSRPAKDSKRQERKQNRVFMILDEMFSNSAMLDVGLGVQ